MNLRTGIDIVEVPRIDALIGKYGDRFIARHFTEAEIDYCQSKMSRAMYFAGRLAAKEAVYKAMNLNWTSGFSWKQIEISHRDSGAPGVLLAETLQELLKTAGYDHIEISISHTGSYAAATALVWGQ